MPADSLSNTLATFGEAAIFSGLSSSEIERIIEMSQPVTICGGQTVCREGDDGQSMYFVQRGQVRVTVKRPDGGTRVLNVLAHGSHFGELSMLIQARRIATVTAVIDTDLLELDSTAFQQAIQDVPQFAANLGRTLGRWLQGQVQGERQRTIHSVAAVVRHHGSQCRLSIQLARMLSDHGRNVVIVTDRPAVWPSQVAQIELDGDPAQVLGQIAAAVNAGQRVLIDILESQATSAPLAQCEIVFWCLPNQDGALQRTPLSACLDRMPRLADTVQIVWVHERQDRLPAAISHDLQLKHADLRLQSTSQNGATNYRPHDLTRLFHRLEGVQFGLALGGGGAKGMAHLGVMQVFEREGIYFDRVAGTSAGAIMTAGYAMGMPPQEVLELLSVEMSPPTWMRRIPRSKELYLLTGFRTGRIEPKFRRYLYDCTFEQLLIPSSMLAVDLVTGEERVRQSGDIVDSIMESINHPIFGKPILRGNEALVDGGVLVNVPAQTLRNQGATFVVAIDVGAKLSHDFARKPSGQMFTPNYMTTLFRVNDVAAKSLANIHMAESDFLITPDTSEFTFEDFTCGAELMQRGVAAAEESLPDLHQAIDRIFASASTSP